MIAVASSIIIMVANLIACYLLFYQNSQARSGAMAALMIALVGGVLAEQLYSRWLGVPKRRNILCFTIAFSIFYLAALSFYARYGGSAGGGQ